MECTHRPCPERHFIQCEHKRMKVFVTSLVAFLPLQFFFNLLGISIELYTNFFLLFSLLVLPHYIFPTFFPLLNIREVSIHVFFPILKSSFFQKIQLICQNVTTGSVSNDIISLFVAILIFIN